MLCQKGKKGQNSDDQEDDDIVGAKSILLDDISQFLETNDLDILISIADEFDEIIDVFGDSIFEPNMLTDQFLEKIIDLSFNRENKEFSDAYLIIMNSLFIENEQFDIERLISNQFSFLERAYGYFTNCSNSVKCNELIHMISTLSSRSENARNQVIDNFSNIIFEQADNRLPPDEISYLLLSITKFPLNFEILTRIAEISIYFLRNHDDLNDLSMCQFIKTLDNIQKIAKGDVLQLIQDSDEFLQLFTEIILNSKIRPRVSAMELLLNLSEIQISYLRMLSIEILSTFTQLKSINTELKQEFMCLTLNLLAMKILSSPSYSIHFSNEMIQNIMNLLDKGPFLVRIDTAKLIKDIIEFGTNANLITFISLGIFNSISDIIESDDTKCILVGLNIVDSFVKRNYNDDIIKDQYEIIQERLDELCSHENHQIAEFSQKLFSLIFSEYKSS
ncbi:hypothetical protein TVAG_166590 [Trichomonas vaginalis G3]|uniref:Uncharacterized protein n=1 Tax=Trichomonas vaginalis (strain ATCC PRA-98 / G3) TaxID=412133 RepID=A2DE66_TRIV3|nr:armadillo (ARM) repeat-containing protein family [Trichomonas vaginalis G3]EAY21284.1 hypothetical protein TVAG_166590 [Trichomonas vaginalis G3]KAI5548858.1 armadillo (ARM) repeat-containing protein family [Trichomonas vaginalis G3]|eukprot:XP_001582270.1 hypothetical protein [Trichomonas vaginalis G3]